MLMFTLRNRRVNKRIILIRRCTPLLRSTKFTKSDLDGICKDISPNKGKILKKNPHKSVFGTGKYDANVLETALKREGVDYEWLKDDTDIDRTVFNDKFLGFILNVEVPTLEIGDTLNVNVPKLKSIQKR